MTLAVSWSGGKDSMLALDRVVRQRLDARVLFNLVHGQTARVRFHGVRATMIEAQADALGLDLVQPFTTPEGFETAFLGGLADLHARGMRGVVFGNIHLADVRAWYEERTTARGFTHIEPLWGEQPVDLVGELLERGYRTRIVSIDLARSSRDWLGRELDARLAGEIAAEPSVDAAGEHGEFHTFVFDGPLFQHPVAHRIGEVHVEEGHAMIDLLPA